VFRGTRGASLAIAEAAITRRRKGFVTCCKFEIFI
jgi:hypothetical protein